MPRSFRYRPPKTAAVALKIQPRGGENGLTYAQIIATAKEQLDLDALGIPPIKIKAAATGARILEVPGEGKSEKADILASKLKELFKEEEVLITRPSITADLRVSGLDDAVTPGILAAVISKAGDCPIDSVKSGEIKPVPAGMGTAYVKCPLTAARKILAAGRLLVGWFSVRIKFLESRPRRCYRCLMQGHVKAQCKSEVDRSNDCHRCGKPGHIAKNCKAAPHCVQCAANAKSAEHLSGSKACSKPPTKREIRKKAVSEASAKTLTSVPLSEKQPVTEAQE